MSILFFSGSPSSSTTTNYWPLLALTSEGDATPTPTPTPVGAPPREVYWPLTRLRSKDEKEALELLEELEEESPKVEKIVEPVREAIDLGADLRRLTSLLRAATEARKLTETMARARIVAEHARRMIEDDDDESMMLLS